MRSPPVPQRMAALARIGVWLVLVPAAINALTGPFIAFSTPASTSLDLPPGAEDAREQIATEERLVGVLLTGFSALAILVAWMHARRPDTLTRVGLVLVTLSFAGLTLVMAAAGGDLTLYYGITTLLVGVGAALAFPSGGRAAP